MNSYISTVGMSRADWLKARQSGIGGSDSPALILPRDVYGWSRPKDVYWSKVSEPEETSPLACRVGSYLEPFVAELFTEATGLKVHRLNKIIVSGEFKYLGFPSPITRPPKPITRLFTSMIGNMTRFQNLS